MPAKPFDPRPRYLRSLPACAAFPQVSRGAYAYLSGNDPPDAKTRADGQLLTVGKKVMQLLPRS